MLYLSRWAFESFSTYSNAMLNFRYHILNDNSHNYTSNDGTQKTKAVWEVNCSVFQVKQWNQIVLFVQNLLFIWLNIIQNIKKILIWIFTLSSPYFVRLSTSWWSMPGHLFLHGCFWKEFIFIQASSSCFLET